MSRTEAIFAPRKRRNDAEDYAQRLYARVPAHYRAFDEERDQPLLALLRLIGRQAADIRRDMDDLWDNFFIETCEDWIVPYLGALVGTNLLAHPVGQSNRLDVARTVEWRRSKGTPAMLRALAEAISGWPTDLAEFFQALGWSQNLNHLRLGHPLTADIRDPYRLSRLGHADDPFAHAADFRPTRLLDQARVTPESLGIGRAGWGTPGRHQIKNLGFFVRRLETFAVTGATPAAAPPGIAAPVDAACFTFDPLFTETPLFVAESAAPLTRAAFDHAPGETFGRDLAVYQHGVLLASDAAPFDGSSAAPSRAPFTFGGATPTLDAAAGLRLLDPRAFESGGAQFILRAAWQADDGSTTTLGSLSTLDGAYSAGSAAPAPGRLAIEILPGVPEGRFPGAVLAVRADAASPQLSDGIIVYLPPAYPTPARFFVADDGSAYSAADLSPAALARPAEGQVYPPRPRSEPSAVPVPDTLLTLNRTEAGLRFADPERFGGTELRAQVEIFTGAFQPLAAVATVDQANADPAFPGPDPWPAFEARASAAALDNTAPENGLLSVLLTPLGVPGGFVPASELIVAGRSGRSLLVYLPEVAALGQDGLRLFVAEDGSTYEAPPDPVDSRDALEQRSLAGLGLARAAAGQILPIPGLWPLQQRRPVALDLCRCERSALLRPGELGIDPERGRFALAPGDPAIGQGEISVDYVEAFSHAVGARNFDRRDEAESPATRRIARSGDAPGTAPVYRSVAEALADAANADEILEIADSATYAVAAEIAFAVPSVTRLTLRAAAGQRPCLVFYDAAGAPAPASLHVQSPLDDLELNGLLVSGGPLRIDDVVANLRLIACTLDPRAAALSGSSIIAPDADPNHRAQYLLCRCITGGLRVGAGIERIVLADSILDQRDGLALAGPDESAPPAECDLHLERVTVFGRVRCDVLEASECLLDDLVTVEDRQTGCIRFSRYELGSILPRRYECVPSDTQAEGCTEFRCLPPSFNSRRFGRPDYAQLAAACPPEILAASEERAEVGAFAGALNPIRLANLEIKLAEFLPVGLSSVITAET